ncbi:hypothetical protein V6380_16585 [Acinetobacter variabilis]|uniref:hypothetical protein n=1 Tax=Acinetobacter variabilis TaxID=70346 RepID=UPI003B83F631
MADLFSVFWDWSFSSVWMLLFSYLVGCVIVLIGTVLYVAIVNLNEDKYSKHEYDIQQYLPVILCSYLSILMFVLFCILFCFGLVLLCIAEAFCKMFGVEFKRH